MTEIEQLRTDLATMEKALDFLKKHECPNVALGVKSICDLIKKNIADLEAQRPQADLWAVAKDILALWLAFPNLETSGRKEVAQYVRHLESKVAELEHELRCERIDGGKVHDDLKAEIAAKDSEAYLGDFRVLKTAQEIAKYSEKHADSPHKLILCRDLVAAINDFTLYVRLWEGLSSLDPYKWSSVGLYDEHLIDKKDGGKVRDDLKVILAEKNREKLAELTTIQNAIPPACGLAREFVERRIEQVKREMQG